MPTNDTAALHSAERDGDAQTETIERRTSDALTRCMTVLPDEGRAAGADDLYTVVSDSGKAYLVDAREGTCECPDHEHRGTRCIHQRRVAFATGQQAIPASVDGVDDRLGEQVDATPRTAATDGGIIVAEDDECEECAALPGEFSCAECYISGEKDLPAEGDQ